MKISEQFLSGQGIGDNCEMVEKMEIYDPLDRGRYRLSVSGG